MFEYILILQSDDDLLNELLIERMKFSPSLASKLPGELKKALKSLLVEGNEMVFTEGDPLLLMVPYLNDADSTAYCTYGNYGLDLGQPGHLAWPGKLVI